MMLLLLALVVMLLVMILVDADNVEYHAEDVVGGGAGTGDCWRWC